MYTAAQAAEAANRSLLEELAATRAKAVAAERAALKARTGPSAPGHPSVPDAGGWMVPWWTIIVAVIMGFVIPTVAYFAFFPKPPDEVDIVLLSNDLPVTNATFRQRAAAAAADAPYDDAFSGTTSAVSMATVEFAKGVKARRDFGTVYISTGSLYLTQATVPEPPREMTVVLDIPSPISVNATPGDYLYLNRYNTLLATSVFKESEKEHTFDIPKINVSVETKKLVARRSKILPCA